MPILYTIAPSHLETDIGPVYLKDNWGSPVRQINLVFPLPVQIFESNMELVKDLGISSSHLDQIEHLLNQSMNGIHLLFDNETIARVLSTPTIEKDLFHSRNLIRIQELFTDFVQRQTLHEKQVFLESLDTKSYEMLLRTYFHIVDNSLYASTLDRH